MSIVLKSKTEIDEMRKAGKIVYQVLERLRSLAVPGVTTGELDRAADQMCTDLNADALFRGVPNPQAGYPFPACICASVDDEVVHGIPSDKRVLKEGQIISIDFGVRYGEFCGDSAKTFAIGKVSDRVQRLLDNTEQVLDIAIANIKPGLKWSHVAAKMQAHVEKAGFSVVTDFVGHGIGREMHEEPQVPNFVSRGLLRSDILLEPGLVIAVEPMVNMGRSAVCYGDDGWTILTVDHQPSAHFEHTIAVTDNGCEVLTDGH